MNLYFECNTGAAGDMIASALVDLFDEKEKILKELNGIGLHNTEITLSEKTQCGISGAHLNIVINGEEETPEAHFHHHHRHHGRNLADVCEIIDSLNVNDIVKDNIKNVYKIVADAEAKAHRKPVGEVHFHELGMLDAIADITISAYLINKLNAQKIVCSPINVGSGNVKCAHGILPVPAPATANILVGVPYYKSKIETELCTPTGAAVLRYFSDEFTEMPRLESVTKIGIGCGNKEFEEANIIRVFAYNDNNEITELSCNVDDMTGEEVAFAAERMMDNGALDCFVSPIIMKKGRPAYMFTVLCKKEDEEKFAKLIFTHTSTIGIRKYTPSRYTLSRELKDEGVTVKRSEGYGTVKEKAEFEDIKALALEKDISIFEARRLINKETDC